MILHKVLIILNNYLFYLKLIELFIDSTSTQNTGLTDSSLRATPAMVRFSKVMHQQREVHPTIVLTLEGIVDQVNFYHNLSY